MLHTYVFIIYIVILIWRNPDICLGDSYLENYQITNTSLKRKVNPENFAVVCAFDQVDDQRNVLK